MASAVDEYVECLLAIPTDRIAEDDRVCCICFDEFGKRKLDGRIEYATALSKETCGHIFGNLCLAKWLKQDGRCPLCRFVLFPKGIDLAELAETRVVLRGGGSFEDGFSDYSTDEEEFETPAEDHESLWERATPRVDIARPPTLDEADEAGDPQASLNGTFSIRGLGLFFSSIWEANISIYISASQLLNNLLTQHPEPASIVPESLLGTERRDDSRVTPP